MRGLASTHFWYVLITATHTQMFVCLHLYDSNDSRLPTTTPTSPNYPHTPCTRKTLSSQRNLTVQQDFESSEGDGTPTCNEAGNAKENDEKGDREDAIKNSRNTRLMKGKALVKGRYVCLRLVDGVHDDLDIRTMRCFVRTTNTVTGHATVRVFDLDDTRDLIIHKSDVQFDNDASLYASFAFAEDQVYRVDSVACTDIDGDLVLTYMGKCIADSPSSVTLEVDNRSRLS